MQSTRRICLFPKEQTRELHSFGGLFSFFFFFLFTIVRHKLISGVSEVLCVVPYLLRGGKKSSKNLHGGRHPPCEEEPYPDVPAPPACPDPSLAPAQPVPCARRRGARQSPGEPELRSSATAPTPRHPSPGPSSGPGCQGAQTISAGGGYSHGSSRQGAGRTHWTGHTGTGQWENKGSSYPEGSLTDSAVYLLCSSTLRFSGARHSGRVLAHSTTMDTMTKRMETVARTWAATEDVGSSKVLLILSSHFLPSAPGGRRPLPSGPPFGSAA